MDKPLISICIPTYNRCDCLKNSIESIICQPEFISGEAEIVVTDNASQDNTEEICREYSEKYSNFHYFRNKENVTNLNFPLSFKNAGGLLRKLSNDTLTYRSGTLKILCGYAEKYRDKKPLIFFENSTHAEGVYDEIIDFDTFVRAEGFRTTWIASMALWDDMCENIMDDTSACSSSLWQTDKIMKDACGQNSAVISGDVLFDVYEVSKMAYKSNNLLFKIFYENFFDIIGPYEENKQLSEETVEFVKKDLLYNFFTKWIIAFECDSTGSVIPRRHEIRNEIKKHYSDKDYYRKYMLLLKKCELIHAFKKVTKRNG